MTILIFFYWDINHSSTRLLNFTKGRGSTPPRGPQSDSPLIYS